MTEKKISAFVDGFIAQVDQMAPLETYEGVVEEEEPPAAAVSCMRDPT